MRKIGGLAAALVLLACTASAAPATVSQSAKGVATIQRTSIQTDMIAELRPYLTKLVATDAELMSEGFGACANLLFRDKDEYRAAVLKDYPDVAVAVDHLTVAAAAKKYLCP
jgi:hypothetical protein